MPSPEVAEQNPLFDQLTSRFRIIYDELERLMRQGYFTEQSTFYRQRKQGVQLPKEMMTDHYHGEEGLSADSKVCKISLYFYRNEKKLLQKSDSFDAGRDAKIDIYLCKKADGNFEIRCVFYDPADRSFKSFTDGHIPAGDFSLKDSDKTVALLYSKLGLIQSALSAVENFEIDSVLEKIRKALFGGAQR